ncbi:related to tRNA isopentenyltransferase [Ramularia collo-cygni]|uniref:tRNA dimethylallyltransferase n=1 Tax=Ramularia collo-cygni TaxID=112498 RepID=A0A2D3VD22_9PEZI|nr:related to tRNA isopentenyltransferase [Ramularia collo-cygni]CZT23635.1 related to tRNA isopentenyltransferase [Ramularia collo-cygni]
MQLYTGLPIITNKITVEEQQGIPHHLLGCIGLHEQTWVVGTFVRHALKIIEEIHARGRLPILVGGTHYYTQSLLFRDRLTEQDDEHTKHEFVDSTAEKWPILQESTETLLAELSRVDPAMAERWHPNDRRKIKRSLEIYLQTGRKASEIYNEQRQRRNSEPDEPQSGEVESMRFPTLMFWINSEPEALRARLDGRVDKMLDSGLLQEVASLDNFADSETANGHAPDQTRGIWVSIGHKEFKEYSAALKAGISDEQRLEALKLDAVERTKIATRQYAKRQLKWIRIKLVNALVEAKLDRQLYLLDGTDVAAYNETVVHPALELMSQFVQAEDMPLPESLSPLAADLLVPKRDYDLAARPEFWTKQHCTACDVTCVTPVQWQQHTRSKTHKKLVSKQKLAERSLDAAPPRVGNI